MSCIVKFNNKEMSLDDFINHLSSLSKNITGNKLQSVYETIYQEVTTRVPKGNIVYITNSKEEVMKNLTNETTVVYNIPGPNTNVVSLLEKMNAIGNPFNPSKYNRDNKGNERVVKMFLMWLETGNNFGETLATENLRQAYLTKLKNTYRGSKIVSTVDSQLANVINYLTLKYGKNKTVEGTGVSNRTNFGENINNLFHNEDFLYIETNSPDSSVFIKRNTTTLYEQDINDNVTEITDENYRKKILAELFKQVGSYIYINGEKLMPLNSVDIETGKRSFLNSKGEIVDLTSHSSFESIMSDDNYNSVDENADILEGLYHKKYKNEFEHIDTKLFNIIESFIFETGTKTYHSNFDFVDDMNKLLENKSFTDRIKNKKDIELVKRFLKDAENLLLYKMGYNMDSDSINLRDSIEFIKENNQRELFKKLSEVLSTKDNLPQGYMEIFNSIYNIVKRHIVNITLDESGMPSRYDPQKNIVYISSNDAKSLPRLTLVVVHEYIHALTTRQINGYIKLDNKSVNALNNLNTLFKKYSSEANQSELSRFKNLYYLYSIGEFETINKEEKDWFNSKIKDYYHLANLDEFIAVGLSQPREMKKLLGNNLWRESIDYIKDLFNISRTNNDFDFLIENFKELINGNIEGQQEKINFTNLKEISENDTSEIETYDKYGKFPKKFNSYMFTEDLTKKNFNTVLRVRIGGFHKQLSLYLNEKTNEIELKYDYFESKNSVEWYKYSKLDFEENKFKEKEEVEEIYQELTGSKEEKKYSEIEKLFIDILKEKNGVKSNNIEEAESPRNADKENIYKDAFTSTEERDEFYRKTEKNYVLKVLTGLRIDPRFVTVNEVTRELRVELGAKDSFNNTVLNRLKKMGVYELKLDPINDGMSVITGTPNKLLEIRKEEEQKEEEEESLFEYYRREEERLKREYEEYLLGADERYLSEDELEQKRALEQYVPEEAESARNTRNEKRPLTDNYKEWINYREAQLKKVDKQITQLHRDRNNPKKDLKKTLELLQKFTLLRNEIDDEIKQFNDEPVMLFSNLNKELDSLFNELDNINNLNFDTFGDKIKFLYEFITGQSFDNKENTDLQGLKSFDVPEYDEVRNKVDELVKKYNDKIDEIRDNIIKNDITFHNNVTNNKNISADDIKKMLEARDDINFLEKYFLGIGQQSGQETLLPQILKSILETKKVSKESESEKLKDKLLEVVNKFAKNEDFSFIFETNEQGVRTGNIIDAYTPEFRKAWYKFKKIAADKEAAYPVIYSRQMIWLKDNMDIIDFRKLPVIKQLYGHLYPNEFKYSDDEMQQYQSELEKNLGSRFDEEMENLLRMLEEFEITKEQIQADSNHNPLDIIKISPYEFIKNFESSNYSQGAYYESKSGNSEPVYFDYKNGYFLPKRKKFFTFDSNGNEITTDTGFYNKKFSEEIETDANKLEYWRVMKDLYSNYINPTYGNGKMSYAKMERELFETVADKKGMFLKGGELISQALKAYKESFFERGTHKGKSNKVNPNYVDTAKSEINEMYKALSNKTLQELENLSREYKISTVNADRKTMIRNLASYIVLSNYSDDINKITASLLDMVALQKAREEVLPIANIILDSHKKITDRFGDERSKSIAKLENFIDKIIKNQSEQYRGTDSLLGANISESKWSKWLFNKMADIPFLKRKLATVKGREGYLLSDTEKELLKFYNEAKEKGHNKDEEYSFFLGDVRYGVSDKKYYSAIENSFKDISEEEYEAAFQEHIDKKISELGLDLNAAGLIQGVLKTIIIKALGLSPIGGMFNRIEGKNTNLIMDMTGNYWTPGNIPKVEAFMSFANLLKILPERLQPKDLKKQKELKKLVILKDRLKLVQDRKNPLERNIDQSKFDFEKYTNLFAMSVDNPEFKNQLEVVLAILMDTKVKDVNGNEVQVFDGKEFKIWNEVNGKLVLKDEFRTEENISNWEDFAVDETNLENNQFLIQRNKMKNAISRTQGNYDEQDTILASKTIWGQVLILFKKWLFEHFQSRFSGGGKGDVDIVTGKKRVIGRYRYLANNNPALLTTGIVGLTTSLGLGIGAAGAIGLGGIVAYKFIKNMYGGNKGIRQEAFNIRELAYFLRSTLISTLNFPIQLVNLGGKIGINMKYDGYSNSNLSEEEIGALRACAKEIATKLGYLSILLLAKGLLWDDDDDEESPKRKFHNFADNQISRMIDSVSMFQNPKALASDASRNAAVMWTESVIKFTTGLTQGEFNTKEFVKTSPLPSLIQNSLNIGHEGFNMPYENNKEFAASEWYDEWTKDYKSGGEYSAKKEYTALRGSGDYDDVKSKITKQKDESYKDILERLKNKQVNTVSEKKRGRPKGSKNKPKEN